MEQQKALHHELTWHTQYSIEKAWPTNKASPNKDVRLTKGTPRSIPTGKHYIIQISVKRPETINEMEHQI